MRKDCVMPIDLVYDAIENVSVTCRYLNPSNNLSRRRRSDSMATMGQIQDPKHFSLLYPKRTLDGVQIFRRSHTCLP